MKKVITGHDGQGKSVFFKVESEAVTLSSPIVDWHEIWATHADDKIPLDTSADKSREQYTAGVHNVFPGTNQSMFRVVDFKPRDAADAPPEELAALFSQLPGIASHMEQDDPGMHTTDSVDYGVIISGNIKLELDDGEQVELTAGDVFVQNGTRHAWRVEEHCRMAVVLVGTDRQ
jgi:mannose-6-phosphate isomerase-like protein (cupin superfamily)